MDELDKHIDSRIRYKHNLVSTGRVGKLFFGAVSNEITWITHQIVRRTYTEKKGSYITLAYTVLTAQWNADTLLSKEADLFIHDDRRDRSISLF